MATYKKPSLQDYLLVEREQSGKHIIGKVQLSELDSIYLPISEFGPIEDLENQIYDLSAFISKLSANFAKTHQNISEINEVYERKETTDYMLTDPSILKEEQIEELINDADLVFKSDVDDAYGVNQDMAESTFETANTKIINWMY